MRSILHSFSLLLPVVAACLLLSACEKNIKIDLPAEPARLVVNADNELGDTIRVTVSRSLTIKESNGQGMYPVVSNATVVLLADGLPNDTLLLQDAQAGRYVSRSVVQLGRSYTLRVDAPGYEGVSAVAACPAPVPVQLISYVPDARTSSEGNTEDKLVLEWDEPATTEDYYILRIRSADSFAGNGSFYGNWYYSCVSTTDISVESPFTDELGSSACIPSNAIFVRDALFNGTKKQLTLYSSTYVLQPLTDSLGNSRYATVELCHVSRSLYLYIKSYLAAINADGNPFAEPINVRGNVEKGYGIFSLLSYSGVEVK